MNHIFFTNSSVEGHLDFQFLGRVTQSVSSSLEGLLEFCCLTLGVFFTGSLLMIASISLGIIGLFNLFIWSLFRFGKWYWSRNFFIGYLGMSHNAPSHTHSSHSSSLPFLPGPHFYPCVPLNKRESYTKSTLCCPCTPWSMVKLPVAIPINNQSTDVWNQKNTCN